MGKYLVIWPKSKSVTHINYHYTQFGECVDYLNKYFPDKIMALDEDVQKFNIEDVILEKDIKKVVVQANYENIETVSGATPFNKVSTAAFVAAVAQAPVVKPIR